jgi:hypothetical protein
VAKNGTVSYEFRAEVGLKPDGSRDRRRFSYRTLAEARKGLRKITTQVAAGTYAKRTAITVDEACDEWLGGRRGIRKVTRYSYENDLKPVRRYLGRRKLQHLTKADGDALVEWMLTEARTSPRHFRPGSLAGRVVTLIEARPEGVCAAELVAAFPGADVHSCLSLDPPMGCQCAVESGCGSLGWWTPAGRAWMIARPRYRAVPVGLSRRGTGCGRIVRRRAGDLG